MNSNPYPIGSPGVPWGEAERAEWLSRQSKQRSYVDDVLSVVGRLRPRFDVFEYGVISYRPEAYPLVALQSRDWRDDLPVVLVTGGVHGYETSGVHGALQFLDQHGEAWHRRVNLLVAPCVSPWAYERIHRWNETRRAYLTLFGHFHQYIVGQGFIGCPTLKGYDAFSVSIGAPREPPSQLFAVLDRQRGLTVAKRIFVE